MAQDSRHHSRRNSSEAGNSREERHSGAPEETGRTKETGTSPCASFSAETDSRSASAEAPAPRSPSISLGNSVSGNTEASRRHIASGSGATESITKTPAAATVA